MTDASYLCSEPSTADIDEDIETLRRQMPGSTPPDGTHRHIGDWLGAMHDCLAAIVAEHDRLAQIEQAGAVKLDAPKEDQ